jgi:predicted nucleic acid-binding protein
LRALDTLISQVDYIWLTPGVLHDAAELWAQARRRGYPGAGTERIDIDIILAAHVLSYAAGSRSKIIATANVRHFTNFVDAREWHKI